MTPALLLMAIQHFLSETLADNVVTIPAVHIGYLPSKTASNRDQPEYPFIIVRALEGKVTDEHKVKVKLLFGTKSNDDEGYLDVLNLVERVRIAILRSGVLERKYRLDNEQPLMWKLYEEQPQPEWVAEATMTWLLPTIREENNLL